MKNLFNFPAKAIPLGTFVLFIVPFFIHAQITSTFDTDAEAWTFTDQNLNGPQTVTYAGTGGNPGGRIASTVPGSQPYFFTSPAKFNGNISYFSYGQNLLFDLQMPVTPTSLGPTGDVVIRTYLGSELIFTLPSLPAVAPAWSSFSVKLDETAGWRLGGTTGPLATKQDIVKALSGVAAIRINGRYISTFPAASASLDNVRLEQRTIQIAPSISSFSLTSGNVGSSITITGNNFDPTVANNAVYFGGIAGAITNASSTQLIVTVPAGAQHGLLTIINKTTGLSKLSAQPFYPTFSEGGRIIPASFKPKIAIDLPATGFGGMRLADIDNDGWTDLVVAAQTNSEIQVFRNLGTGGDISATSFAPYVSFPTGAGFTNGSGMRVMDLDGDGKLDATTSGWLGGFTGVFVTFRNVSTPGTIAFETREHWVAGSDESPPYAAADIDGDGLPELISGEGSGGAGQNIWITQNISTPGNIEFGTSLFYFSDTVDDGAVGANLGNLDNDGKPDIILTTGQGAKFSIVKNTSTPGSISFGTPITFPEGYNGREITIADFNLDGKNDLAWASLFSGNDIHIRLNTNTGAPLAATDFATEVILQSDLSYSSGGISIADINGDGKPDVVATDDADIGVFENVYSGGAFDASAFVSAYQQSGGGASTYPSAPLVGDLNGDNKPDLVFGTTNSSPHRLSIFQNKNIHTPVISINTVSPLKGPVGSTITITGDYFSTTPSENIVRFGDVTTTAITSTKTQLTVTVPPGASMAPVSVTKDQLTASYHLPFVPTFSPGVTFDNTHFAPPINFTLTGASYDLDAGDINNDGKPDVIADVTVAQAYAFRNTHTTGNISATSLMPDDSINSGPYPHLMDLDGDGNMDMLSGVGPFRNVSTGNEINFSTYTYINPGGYYYNDFADFNRDGKTDLIGVFNGTHVSLNENRTTTGPFLNSPIQTFSDSYNYIKPGTGGSVVAADFDKDGLVDFASTNPSTDNVTVWKNDGAYRISTTQFSALPDIAAGDNPARIYQSDLDSDGKMDLVINHGAGTNSTMITVLHNQSTGTISFNRFDFTIPAASTVAHISDLDGDGKPEIIVTSESTDQFFILKNTSTSGVMNASSFASPFIITVNNPRGLATSDLNLDGKPEIIITAAPNSLLVYENLVPTGPSISINPQPLPSTVCSGATTSFNITAIGTTNIIYQWQFSSTLAGTYNDIGNGNGYSNVATNTLSVNTTGNFGTGFYRCKVSGDLAASVFSSAAQLIIDSLPIAPTTTGASTCASGSVTVSATGGSNGQYRWYTVATGGTAIGNETASTFTTPVLNANTNYFVSIDNGTCESLRAQVMATIITVAPPTTTGASDCTGSTFILTASGGTNGQYRWYTVATGGTAIGNETNSTYTTPVLTANTDYFVSINNGTCESTRTQVTAIITNGCAPVIATELLVTVVEGKIVIDLKPLITTAGTLDVNSITVTAQPSISEAVATVTNGVLTIDYKGISFSGRESITIEACTTTGVCAQQTFDIDVAGDIVVYNALSPGTDGKNDIFLLQYIDILETTKTNRVTIFNRWGDVVFDVDNYNNTTQVFKGESNDGKDLPSGIYFYKITFGGGAKAVDGFISLKR